MEYWNIMIKTAKDLLLEAQERQSKYANQHRRHEEFNLEDKVLLSTHNIESPVDKQRTIKKLS